MPYQTDWQARENIREVIANQTGIMKLIGLEFAAAYWPEDANGVKEVRPGLIIAKNTDLGQFVPYNSSAAYGTGSDTAVGVFADDFIDVTHGNYGMTPVYHGEIIEDNCYELGGSLGSVSSTIKGHLADIHWV